MCVQPDSPPPPTPYPLLSSERKCCQSAEKPWCTQSLISHGSALTSAPNLKRLDKLHTVYWLNGGLHFGLSAPINYWNVLWTFSHLLQLGRDCSILPTGDREWFSQDAEARVTEELRWNLFEKLLSSSGNDAFENSNFWAAPFYVALFEMTKLASFWWHSNILHPVIVHLSK